MVKAANVETMPADLRRMLETIWQVKRERQAEQDEAEDATLDQAAEITVRREREQKTQQRPRAIFAPIRLGPVRSALIHEYTEMQ